MRISKGLIVRLEAKPGKEEARRRLSSRGVAARQEEPKTVAWFAFQTGASSFAIVDVFPDEDGRQAHLEGPVAAALSEARRRTPRPAAADRERRRARDKAAVTMATANIINRRRELAHRVGGGLEVTLYWNAATTAPASRSATPRLRETLGSRCRTSAPSTPSTTRSPMSGTPARHEQPSRHQRPVRDAPAVRDLDRSVDFYRDIVGLPLALTSTEPRRRLLLDRRPRPGDARTVGARIGTDRRHASRRIRSVARGRSRRARSTASARCHAALVLRRRDRRAERHRLDARCGRLLPRP